MSSEDVPSEVIDDVSLFSDVSGDDELSFSDSVEELLSDSTGSLSGAELSVSSVTGVNGATDEVWASSPFITL